MLKVYLDTSALVKLYYPEEETDLLSRWIAQNNEPLIFTSLHELELNNALSLKVFRKELSKVEQKRILKIVESDLLHGVLQRPKVDWGEVLGRSISFSQKKTPRIGCRSLDILHVALAVHLERTHFVSFDDRQRQLAKTAGLRHITIS